MKILITLFAISSVFLDTTYRSKSVECSVISTVTKEYELKLKTEDSFIYTFRSQDSRYPRASVRNFSGQWSYKSDTLVLIGRPSEELVLGEVRFFKKEDTLMRLTNNLFMPEYLVADK